MSEEIYQTQIINPFTILDDYFQGISDTVGVQVDQIRFTIGLFSVIPLGFGFQFIKGAWIRHFIGIVLGLSLEYMVYKNGIVSMLVQTVLTYVMALKIKNCGKWIMIQNLVFMSAHHIYRQMTDYGGWTLDITTILMMAICKFTSFGYNVEDGRQDPAKLTEFQKKRKIDRMPHFLEYFSYIHFFGSSIVGPAYDFYDYKLFINQKDEMKKIPFVGALKETAKQCLQGVCFMAATVLVTNKFDLFYISTEEFGQQNIFYKFFFYNIVVTLYRFKYYGGWSLAQAGVASTGLSYSGDSKFDRIQNCHPRKVELTHEIRNKVKFWNMSVQRWLENYVYQRLYTAEQYKKSKSLATKGQYLTLLISAFWHGFYPGYYTSFFQWGMMITINKMTWKWATNYPAPFARLEKKITKPVYWVARFLFFNGLFNYFGCGFQILSLDNNFSFYKNLLFIPNILTFALTGWLLATNIGQRPPQVKEGDNFKPQQTPQ